MKIIYIVLNVSDLNSFAEKIRKCKLIDYQIIEQMLTNSLLGNPRTNTAVWPGYSSGIIIQSDEEMKIQLLFDEIREHNKNRINDEEIIRAFVLNTEAFIIE